MTNLAPIDGNGELTIHHITAGRDYHKVEHTLCGLTIPRDAMPCRKPIDTPNLCLTCQELDA